MRAKDVSNMLASRALDVARFLLNKGVVKADNWVVGDIYNNQGNSLKIQLTGSKAGLWSDFATGEGGDLLDLWSISKHLMLADAIREAKDFLGIKDVMALMSARETIYNKAESYKKPNPEKLEALRPLSVARGYLENTRELSQEIVEKYLVMQNGEDIAFPYYSADGLEFIKYLKTDRPQGKKQMWVEAGCKPILFGWQALPWSARTVTICEGEIDAMSLSQYGFPALSVPLGAGNGSKHDWINHEFDKLAHFDEIFICMDSDDAGKLAAREIADRLGFHRCRIVQLPFKDANECLKNAVSKEEMQKCFESARTIDPEELKSSSLYRDLTWDRLTPRVGQFVGYEPLWEYSKGKVLFRPNELSVWTGINGHGKSQFLGQVVLQMIQQGAKVCIASMELKPESLLMRMCRQATALREPSREFFDATFDWFDGHLWLFELVGTANSQTLLDVFLYARQRYGIDVFVIDSFLKLDIAEDDYKNQKSFLVQLVDFKNQHDCQVHIVVHPRKGIDESSPPHKLDTKGTGAITDLADNCFSVWRNKAKEEVIELQKKGIILGEKEREKLLMADAAWYCDKQRHGEWEGVMRFWFDKESLQYRDSEGKKPTAFVEYSCID